MDMFIYPEYEVVRNPDLCIGCRVCERQCANEVHHYDFDLKKMVADSAKCVNCHRCVCLCPTHALKIVKSQDTYKTNANWENQTINEVYRQAATGGVLLSSIIFGAADSLATRLQMLNVPARLVQALPYAITIIAIAIYSYIRTQRKAKNSSGAAAAAEAVAKKGT